MQLKTFLLLILVVALTSTNASALFAPPHVYPTPEPTPAPYTPITFDFTIAKEGNTVYVNGYQTSGSALSPFTVWSWQFTSNGKVVGTTGQSTSKTLGQGTYTVGLTVSDWITGQNGKVVKKKAISI